jgi:hypothetical protein
MKLKRKLIKGGAAIVLGASLLLAIPKLDKPFGIRAAVARTAKKYNPNTNPLAAGSKISAIAKKARRSNDLESAKELHKLLKVGAPGGLRESKSARSTTKDEKPKTANETMKSGGDCSEFSYVVLAALRKMGIRKMGLVLINLGASSRNTVLMHTIAYAQINGKKYLIDPQPQIEFEKGGATVRGKTIKFTYKELISRKAGVKFVRDSPYPSAAGAYHFEWGTYLEGKKKFEEALSAFKRALTIDPKDIISAHKVKHYSAHLFYQLLKKANIAFKKKQWKQSADYSEKALTFWKPVAKEILGGVHGNIGICRFKTGDFQKAAFHFTKAFKLTGNKQFEQFAKEAKKRSN